MNLKEPLLEDRLSASRNALRDPGRLSPRGHPTFAARVAEDHPRLNVLVNNAGIRLTENLLTPDFAKAEAMVTTNLLGPIRLTAALLPPSTSRTAPPS